MTPAAGTLGKYVVHNFICLCFMIEGSYITIYTQDHNSSPERGLLRITPPPGEYEGASSYPPPPPTQGTYNNLYGIAFTY